MPDSAHMISQKIMDLARKLGFDACGIAPAGQLEKESEVFRNWLKEGHHAGMGYMNRNVDKRLDPRLLNDWARSVIMLQYNYYPSDDSLSTGPYKIAKYAYGRDYHGVMKDKLRRLVEAIEDEIGGILARVFVDSAPVLEKAWARRSGLGWIGKNGCLINKEKGSFFFLGCIITNMELAWNKEEATDRCGNCTACIDACPNKAIIAPGIVDARKCISYLSIEHKGPFEKEYEHARLHGWIFGCDICQDVCPWNRFAKAHTEAEFLPRPGLRQMKPADWENLDEEGFKKLFEGSALERAGFEGLKRNIERVRKEQD